MPLGQVAAGMVLAAPVANPKQPEYDLLKAGFELNSPMIDRLRELGVRTLWIAYPSLDFLDAAVSPKITEDQQRVYQSLKKSFAGGQRRVVARIDFHEYRRTLAALISSIGSQHADILMVDPLLAESGDILLHCSNVCYIAVMMGVRLGHYLVQQRVRVDPRHARDVMNLGLGALLHDVGKMRVPAELREYEPEPGAEVPIEWQRHVAHGFDMIRGKVEPSAAQAALHHHQRWDGEGFPILDSLGRPLAGERIHVFSRIVTMADQYERQLQRAHAQNLPPIAAMKSLRGPAFRGVFDPIVFQTFSDLVPPFPIGSMVGLSDGGHAVVLIHNADDPCRPSVRRLPDPAALARGAVEPGGGEDVDLAERSDLFIVAADGVDVEPFLFDRNEGIAASATRNRQLSLADETVAAPA